MRIDVGLGLALFVVKFGVPAKRTVPRGVVSGLSARRSAFVSGATEQNP